MDMEMGMFGKIEKYVEEEGVNSIVSSILLSPQTEIVLTPVTTNPAAPESGCIIYLLDEGEGLFSLYVIFSNGEIKLITTNMAAGK